MVKSQLLEKDNFLFSDDINKLLSLQEGKNWKEIFTPMPTKRQGTATISSNEHLIVAGGAVGLYMFSILKTVEVLDTNTLLWSTVANLIHPLRLASATICGDHLYTKLLQSSSSSSVWHRIADAPAYRSTCTAVNGELLAVGGCDEGSEASAAIHKYNPTANSWDHISNMTIARFNSLVAVLPTNELMVIGGCNKSLLSKPIDSYELATFDI